MKIKPYYPFITVCLLFLLISCSVPRVTQISPTAVPSVFRGAKADSVTSGDISWRVFFKDENLRKLIDTALIRNSDLQMALRQIEIARISYKTSRMSLLPEVALNAGLLTQKESATISYPESTNPAQSYTDRGFSLSSTWEIDLWGKLQAAGKASKARLMATQSGMQFVQTQLVAEVAKAYYGLMALDEQLSLIEKNIRLQTTALDIVKVQKQAGKATTLAVQQFEAQLLNTRAQKYNLAGQILCAENYLNLLIGRLPQPIVRSSSFLKQELPALSNTGVPMQLLERRPDISEATLNLKAAGFDVTAARKAFYPSLTISPVIGFASSANSLLIKSSSLTWSVANGLVAPLFQRNQIKGAYRIREIEQKQALIQYEKVLRQSITEVQEAIMRMKILNEEMTLKSEELSVLDNAVSTSHNLYAYGYATYLEVINAQKTVRDAEIELINVHKERLDVIISLYRALGGGR